MEKLKLIEGLGGEYLAEEIIKRSKDSNIIYLTEDISLNTKCVQELARYLENLIQENKEYEEGKKLSQKQEEMIIKVIQETAEEQIPKEMKNFISKNKIRDKIKKYETIINQNKLMSIKVRQHGFTQENIIQTIISAIIEMLKEFLEE